MRLHFRQYGSGRPLIILHGLFGSLNHWQTMARRLGDHFTVFTVDLRNHGHSPQSAEFDYGVMADDVREFLLEHDLSPAILLGHSMGGKVAMELAFGFPRLVERLIVVDIGPKAYASEHDALIEAMESVDLDSCTTRGDIDRALEPKVPDVALRQFLLTNLQRDETGKYRWKIHLTAIRANSSEVGRAQHAAAPLAGPVLFIRGGQSGAITPADEPGIRRLFPQATFVTIAGAGHWVHANAPEEFLRVVLDFLQRKLPVGRGPGRLGA